MKSSVRIFSLLAAAILCLICNYSLAVVPQRLVNDIYPVDETIASFTKAINSRKLDDSALAELYRERGVHYSDLGHYEEAIADLSNAIRLNNSYVTAYISRANAFAKLEKYNDAFQDFAVAQKLSPDNKTIYVLRGSMNFLLGRFNDAVSDFKQYLRLEPKDMYRMLWLHLSEAYQDSSKPTDLEHYTKGMNLDIWPGALVKLYLKRVGPKDFLEAFTKNIESMKAEYLCEGFYYLGQYLLLTGDRKLAEDSFKQAVKTNARKTMEYQFAMAYVARLAK